MCLTQAIKDSVPTAAKVCESVQAHDETETQGPLDASVAHLACFGGWHCLTTASHSVSVFPSLFVTP